MTGAEPAAPPAPGCGCPRPARRGVLRAGLAAAGVLAAPASAGPVRLAFGRAGNAAPATASGVLVVLSLRGGFDGLSAVVPAGDPEYARARPGIGIPGRTLLPAGGIFGLHPALAPLKPFWDAGTFGAVHAVGQADPTRSHFRAMAELERAAPGTGIRTGWLDRTLGLASAGTPFRATVLGTAELPASLAGPVPALSMTSVDDFDLYGGFDDVERARWAAGLAALHAGAAPGLRVPVDRALAAVATTSRLAAAGYTPAPGATYPQGPLGDALRDVARLVKADVGLRVACVDDGDWDLHAAAGGVDGGAFAGHLGSLAAALAAFGTDLGPLLSTVTLVTLSEFGRRVAENGSGGTDHGHGNAVLLLGGGVVGGRVHGRWPGLAGTDLVDGDLAGTTDYRLLLAEILRTRCGFGSTAGIFPGLRGDPLGIVRPA